MRSFIALAGLFLSLGSPAQNSLIVEVRLSGPSSGGTLRMALCPTSGAYDTEQGCLTRVVRVVGSTAEITYEGLEEGRYAIKTFHDVNDNGELDTNWIGIPLEPYGFSNDAMGTFGPPSFEQAGSVVKPGANTVRLRMKG